MASELAGFIKDIGRGFDEERNLTYPPNSWLALLGRAERTSNTAFRQLKYFDKSFIPRSNNFRTGFYVEIATPENLQPILVQCSHFAVNGQIYATEEADMFPPSGDRFSWLVYGAFVKQSLYTPII